MITLILFVLTVLASFTAGALMHRNNAENAIVKFVLGVIDSLWAKRSK
jgi:uncharacterized membrane protein YeaQ/YmgE (transglycosylase-associated protein family)